MAPKKSNDTRMLRIKHKKSRAGSEDVEEESWRRDEMEKSGKRGNGGSGRVTKKRIVCRRRSTYAALLVWLDEGGLEGGPLRPGPSKGTLSNLKC